MGTLNDRFELLRRDLAASDRVMLLDDLMGVSGALFRFYWYSGGDEKHPDVWDDRAAAVCGGDPLDRAAHAYSFEIASVTDSGFSLRSIGAPKSLGDRIDSFVDSLDVCLALWREGDSAAETGFAGGSIGYANLLDTIVTFEHTGLESGPARALGGTIICYGECRKMLTRYLSRVANFMEIAPAIAPFQREGEALRDAGRLLMQGECRGRVLRRVEKYLWTAVNSYDAGCTVVDEFLSGRGEPASEESG